MVRPFDRSAAFVANHQEDLHPQELHGVLNAGPSATVRRMHPPPQKCGGVSWEGWVTCCGGCKFKDWRCLYHKDIFQEQPWLQQKKEHLTTTQTHVQGIKWERGREEGGVLDPLPSLGKKKNGAKCRKIF